MYIVSHRCGSLENEEHTITAINHSLTLNIYSIEVDIQFTENNEIVLSHDPVRTNKKYTKLEFHHIFFSYSFFILNIIFPIIILVVIFYTHS